MTDIYYTLLRLQGDQDWQPPINMYESEKEFWIEVELGGMEKEEIKVIFEKNVLTISGNRKKVSKAPNYVCYQLEMEYGSFCRFIRFNGSVEPSEIEARYEKGILNIHVPKILIIEEDR